MPPSRRREPAGPHADTHPLSHPSPPETETEADTATKAPAPATESLRIAAPAWARASLQTLREAATRCHACPLWRHATQTVFGEGNARARLMLVGEQPGNSEDLNGLPFIGPAGQLLERALIAGGTTRDAVYVTNAVKHFKWELRGKRRLHKTPVQREIDACLPWLQAEIELVAPKVVLCLGATAARAVLGGPVRIGEHRGQSIRSPAGQDIVVTMHPAYVLRLKGGAAEEAYRAMAEDIRLAVNLALARA